MSAGNDWPAALMAQVEANVTRVGWHATGVFGGGALFMYTTGLSGGGRPHPELVVAGLPAEVSHGLLSVAADLVRSGTRFAPGRDYPGIAVGFSVRFRPVRQDRDRLRHPLSVTSRFYGRQVPALQLVWPDPKGRFPGEAGCDPAMAQAQDIHHA